MENILEMELPEELTEDFIAEQIRSGIDIDEIVKYPMSAVVLSVIEENIRNSKKDELTEKDIRNIILKSHKRVSTVCHEVMGVMPEYQQAETTTTYRKPKPVWWKDILLVFWTIIKWIGMAAFFLFMAIMESEKQNAARENEPGWGMKNPTLHSNALQWDRTFNGNRVGTHFSRWSHGYRYASHSVCGNKMYIIATNGRFQETVEADLRTGCSTNKGRRSIT